jgi:hypothetical protein
MVLSTKYVFRNNYNQETVRSLELSWLIIYKAITVVRQLYEQSSVSYHDSLNYTHDHEAVSSADLSWLIILKSWLWVSYICFFLYCNHDHISWLIYISVIGLRQLHQQSYHDHMNMLVCNDVFKRGRCNKKCLSFNLLGFIKW